MKTVIIDPKPLSKEEKEALAGLIAKAEDVNPFSNNGTIIIDPMSVLDIDIPSLSHKNKSHYPAKHRGKGKVKKY